MVLKKMRMDVTFVNATPGLLLKRKKKVVL